VLLPAVRAAPASTLIMADGFSCREQIAQGTGRRALHLAQVVQMALREAARAPRLLPELGYERPSFEALARRRLRRRRSAWLGTPTVSD